MFTKYMRSLSNQDFPVVLSITDTTLNVKADAIIQRNDVRSRERSADNDFYIRAREIYYRARQQSNPVRA